MGGFCIRNAKAFSGIPSSLLLTSVWARTVALGTLTERMSGKVSVFAGHIVTTSKIRVPFLKEGGMDIGAAISNLYTRLL